MRVKGARSVPLTCTGPDDVARLLEQDPVLMVHLPAPSPFKLVPPLAPSASGAVAAVAVAAVRVKGQFRHHSPHNTSTQPNASKASRIEPGAAIRAGTKRKQPPKAEGSDALAGRGKAGRTSSTDNSSLAELLGPDPTEPFCLVAPHANSEPAATLVAAALDVASLARALRDGEEQRRRLAQQAQQATDGRAIVQVLRTRQPSICIAGGAQTVLQQASSAGKPPRSAAKPETAAGVKARPKSQPHRPSAAGPGTKAQLGGTGSPGVRDSGTWHPGMVSSYGITYVDPVKAVAAKPPPPVLTADPVRWTSMPLRPGDVQTFPEAPLAAALGWLRYLASAAGRLPHYPPALQQSFNAEQRMYRERLARALQARDGRSVDKPAAQGMRRSARARVAPDVFIPTVVGGPEGRFSVYGRAGRVDRSEAEPGAAAEALREAPNQQEIDPLEATDVRLGQEFQCALPPLRKRPAAPPEGEGRWLQSLVLDPGAAPPPRAKTRNLKELPQEQRAAAVEAATSSLATALGPAAAAAFGLGTMGAAAAAELDHAQQCALGQGMTAHGRDFNAVASKLVPGKTAGQLASYYYDVWKLRATPAVLAWCQQQAEFQAAREAEEAVAERQREELAALRAERAEASNRRRQVKDAIAWVRSAAKCPAEVNFNKPVVRERALRVARALRRDGVAAAAAT